MKSSGQVGRNIALASIFISATLAAAKIVVGLKAHSTAVVSDGVESFGIRSDGNLYVLNTSNDLTLNSPDGTQLVDFGTVQGFAACGGCARGCSRWSCTPTCPGWPITAAGRSARNGSTSRGRPPTCR